MQDTMEQEGGILAKEAEGNECTLPHSYSSPLTVQDLRQQMVLHTVGSLPTSVSLIEMMTHRHTYRV